MIIVNKDKIDLICELLSIDKNVRRFGIDFKLEKVIKIGNGDLTFVYFAPAVIRSIDIKGTFTYE